MFIAAKYIGDAMDVMFSHPYFPENKESAKSASAEGTDKEPNDIFKEILMLCGFVAQKTPATEETVEKIKDLFKEIAELKDMVEKTMATHDVSVSAVAEESTDIAEEKPTEQKSEIIESRVTGSEGPATPML